MIASRLGTPFRLAMNDLSSTKNDLVLYLERYLQNVREH